MGEARISLPIDVEADGRLRFHLGRAVECILTLPDGSRRRGWVSAAEVHQDGSGEASVMTTFPYRAPAADVLGLPLGGEQAALQPSDDGVKSLAAELSDGAYEAQTRALARQWLRSVAPDAEAHNRSLAVAIAGLQQDERRKCAEALLTLTYSAAAQAVQELVDALTAALPSVGLPQPHLFAEQNGVSGCAPNCPGCRCWERVLAAVRHFGGAR